MYKEPIGTMEKYGHHHNRETAKIRICTPLTSVIYFQFVSETISVASSQSCHVKLYILAI